MVAAPLVLAGAQAASASGTFTYTAGTPSLATVQDGPWTLSQGDPTAGLPYNESLPTYTPGGSPAQTGGYPNLAVYPGATSPPYASGVVGTPGPVPAYCTGDGPAPESGTQAAETAGANLPMSPYYFPFIMQTPGDPAQGHLTGYFDYRPKDTEEALVAARSTDGGHTWVYEGKALEQNPENYCPTGDTNDNGQGHAFVMNVGGQTLLYTLNRPAGDNVGVGLLARTINAAATNPLAGLPAYETVGTDPDTFASSATAVPASGGGTTIAVTTVGTGAEVVAAGQFEDLSAADPSASVITCTGTGGSSLTGCTNASGAALAVTPGDALVQVMADVTTAVAVPAGPNNLSGTGGASISLNVPLSTIAQANVPGRFYLDGDTVYCVNISSAGNQLQNCTTTAAGGLSVSAGDALTSDAIVPADAGQPGGPQQTKGLTAPDGIVGVIPSSIAYPGAPSGATVVIYGEKILNYYIEGTTTAAVTLPATTIAITPSSTPTQPIPASGSFNIYLGTPSGIQTVTCTGYSASTFTGCSGGTGSVSAGSKVGGPGAAIASSATLGAIGEGSSSAKNLFKNNEDLTVLRAAYTTDGVNFTDLGAISGTDPGQDINNPSSQAAPANPDLPVGSQDTPELRYVGTRGTVITNPDGSIGMFNSGAWQSDGDSDAFNQIFYTSSTDGVHWTTPVVVESTDYTFSARYQQDAALASGNDTPLGISAYYAGRAYGPTVVQNPDGTLTMVFAGYSTPKPLPAVGSKLGDGEGGAPQWAVSADDPALYRNILTVTLTLSPTGGQLPESPVVIALPVLGSLLGGGVLYARYKRRTMLAA